MKKIVFLAVFILSIKSLAQDESLSLPDIGSSELVENPATKFVEIKKETSRKTVPTNVLDFEGEVIEGERRRPDLFLQMSIDNVKFDSLIYNREDFNDYLEVDRRGRTRYLKLK